MTTNQVQLLLPPKTVRKVDNNLKPFPNYAPKFEPHQYLTKNWTPCTTPIVKLKRKLDKLSADYDQCVALGMYIKGRRMLQKAIQLDKRIAKELHLPAEGVLRLKPDAKK